MKKISCISLVLLLKIFGQVSSYGDGFQFPNMKDLYQDNFSERNEFQCLTTRECPPDFYCKFNDCVAKKQEGSLCLTHGDDECQCGKCSTSPYRWIKKCESQYCENNGITHFNECENDFDCPKNYFCNFMDHNLCTSKLKPGKPCNSDNMCSCNRCSSKSIKSRPNMPAMIFKTCDAC